MQIGRIGFRKQILLSLRHGIGAAAMIADGNGMLYTCTCRVGLYACNICPCIRNGCFNDRCSVCTLRCLRASRKRHGRDEHGQNQRRHAKDPSADLYPARKHSLILFSLILLLHRIVVRFPCVSSSLPQKSATGRRLHGRAL